MRIRHTRTGRLIVAGILVAAPALGLASAAHAAGGEPETVTLTVPAQIGECKGEERDALIEAEGTEQAELLEDCFSSKSPIIPKWSEVIWGGIAWLIVMLGLVKYALPALKKTMHAREEKIRTDLEAAEGAKTTAEGELAQYRAQLADARTEASRIIEEARQGADQVRQERLAAVEAEAEEMRARAQEDIRLASERAMADLRGQVATMSVELAEKIVERNLDASTQQALIDSYISRVGNNN